MSNSLQWIIMADVIHSSAHDALALQRAFKFDVNYINKEYEKRILSPLTITLGDEFQGVIKDLKTCIEIIFSFEEHRLQIAPKYELRYIVQQGEIETEINPNIAYGMLGIGLSQARKNLENLKKTDQRYFFDTSLKPKSNALNSAFQVYQNIYQNWTKPEERQLVALFLENNDYKYVAEKTGKTRSQIWKREKSLNISSYFAIKTVIKYLGK
jgi:hypothetical protein